MYDKYIKTGAFSGMSDPITGIGDMNLKGKLVATAFRDKIGDSWNYKVYGYDPLGRVTFYAIKLANKNWKKLYYTYDNLGNVTKLNLNDEFYFWYEYDLRGNLYSVSTGQMDKKNTSKLEAVYNYNDADQIISISYPQISDTSSFTTFNYENSRGWLNKIINGDRNFIDSLSYANNGNIQNQSIINKAFNITPQLNLGYLHDKLNRLLSVAGYPNSEAYSYDKDGNILTKNSGGQNLSYYYPSGSNKATTITNLNNNERFLYSYDGRGNLNYDQKKGITIAEADYDFRNLPLKMSHSTDNFYYKYDDAGNRILKTTPTTTEYYLRDISGREIAVYDYVNDKLKLVNIYGNGLIGRVELYTGTIILEDQ